jgi:hypothetical protein
MKAKTLVVLSTAVLLSMSVAAKAKECDKEFWLTAGDATACVPYGIGTVTIGTIHFAKPLAYLGVAACAYWHRPARLCGWAKVLHGSG